MARDHVVTLISTAYRTDSLFQRIPVEQRREVPCQVGGIRQSEWFSAGQKGLRPQMMLTVFDDDYLGETIAEVDGVRYGVYRTYPAKHDKTELYLEKKGGV